MKISAQRFLADDDIIVMLSNIMVQGESIEQADVLTYRDGKVVRAKRLPVGGAGEGEGK